MACSQPSPKFIQSPAYMSQHKNYRSILSVPIIHVYDEDTGTSPFPQERCCSLYQADTTPGDTAYMLHHQLISLRSLVAVSSKFLCCSFAKPFFNPWETQSLSVDARDAPKQVSLPLFSNQSTPVLSTTEITAAT